MRIIVVLIAAVAVVGAVSIANGAPGEGAKASSKEAQASAGKRGPRGPRGPAGPQGPQGSPGLADVTVVDGPPASYPPGGYGGAPHADCPAGMVVIGTGFNGPFDQVGGFVLAYGTFVGGFFENDSSITLGGGTFRRSVLGLLAGSAARGPCRRRVSRSMRWMSLPLPLPPRAEL